MIEFVLFIISIVLCIIAIMIARSNIIEIDKRIKENEEFEASLSQFISELKDND